MEFYSSYRYLIVPFLTFFCIQTFKVLWELIKTKKINFKRIMGAGGMPSSHSATTVAIATMIGKSEGISSPMFALAVVFALVVMYDACGVRRHAKKKTKILNEIINTPGLTTVQVNKKLVELIGHTPFQVIVGAIIGFIVGIIF